jgi:hypothetical protein
MTPDDARALLARLLHRIAPEIDLDEIDPPAPLRWRPSSTRWTSSTWSPRSTRRPASTSPSGDYPVIASIEGFVACVTAASPTTSSAR